MVIIKAQNAGFCFGVNNAVNKAVVAAHEYGNESIYTYGELIHNPFVVKELSDMGIHAVDSLNGIEEGILIIRSHGASPCIYKEAYEKKLSVIDATCPYVKSIQNKVEKYHKKGYTVVIVGDKSHPEVIGINGWCENEAVIIGSAQEFCNDISLTGNICVVAQTTIPKNLFDDVCAKIKQISPDAIVFNTICSTTSLRQQETEKIAKKADVMIVIGGFASSNTKKLADTCRKNCKTVIQIESAEDLQPPDFENAPVVGITAGASTPEHIILEVVQKMENSMENLEKSLDDFKRLKVGDIVKGKIISVNEDEVYVDISYKSDGIIKKADFLMDLYTDLPSTVAIGDEVEAMITDMNDGIGNVVLSKIKVDEIAAMKVTQEKFESKETLPGKIVKVVKGGFIVDLSFAKAFMPAYQYALKYVEDINALLGKEVEGRIIEFDKDKNKIIFSRRVILQEALDKRRAEEAQKRQTAMAALEVGNVLSAPVKNITDFGIFLDLNGVDGFVHISDLSWKRIGKPQNFCKVGDVLEAKITELDRENNKVKLSVKDMTEEPWSVFSKQFKVGAVTEGTIKSITKFGAFAEIVPGVEGLIHISNISYDKVDTVESVLKVGDTVKFKIMDIDNEKRKIGLSIKDLSEAPKRKVEQNKIFYKEDSHASMEEAFKKYLK